MSSNSPSDNTNGTPRRRPERRLVIHHEVRIEHVIRVGPTGRCRVANKRLEAMVLRLEHPGWTHQQIAEALEIDRRQLYRWDDYLRLSRSLCEPERVRKGFRNNGTGEVDALDR